MAADTLLELVTDIAREAGALAKRRRDEGVSIAASKSSIADIVTEADREVEALVRARVSAERPGDGFLGEESGAEASATGLTWVVDPIDGTVNYAFGIPAYAVSIAVVSGEPAPESWTGEVGVVFNPASGELFHASRGEGAWLGAQRLRMSQDIPPAGALIGTGFGYDKATHAPTLERLARVMPLARDIRRIGAASLDLAFVAAGRLDAYYERGLKPWDQAAGALLVREAGGVVGDGKGGPGVGEMLIAANEALYERIAEMLAKSSSE